MKKVAYIIAVAAAMLTVACSKEEVKTPDSEEQGLVTYTFTAVYDDQVKSTLTTGGVFTWTEGDKIAIWNSAAGAYVTFIVGEVTNGEATITGTASAGAVWGFAVYPASRAAGDGDAVDYTTTTSAGPILVSKVPTDQTLSFKYLGSVMNLQVNSVPDTPVTLSLTASANVFGVRSFTWADNADTPTLGAISSGAQASVTVPFNTSGITTVPVPNVDLVGFTITVDNAAGRHLYKKTTASTAPLSTKILVNMPALDYVAPSKFYVTTVSSSKYWDRSNVRMIQTGANDYSVQMNCDGGSDIYIFDNYNVGNETVGYLNKGYVSGGNFYEITWNTSSKTGGPSYISATRDYPFWHEAYPVGVNEMCLSGEFNNWGYANTFTYNTNMSWSLEGLELAAGTYNFKIRKAQNDWAYAAGVNSGLGSSMYGTLKGDANNASITVTAGTYNVYLNATSEWYYNIMFEKQ